jgi:Flp pilus assembly protein TadG
MKKQLSLNLKKLSRPLFRPFRARGSRKRGQSLVEMALMMPIILIIMASVFDVGRVLDASIVITNAARVGARFGANHPTWYDSIRARVVDFANDSGMNFSGVTLQGSHVAVGSSGVPGTAVIVTVTYDLPLYFGPAIGVNTIRIVRAAEMMILVP